MDLSQVALNNGLTFLAWTSGILFIIIAGFLIKLFIDISTLVRNLNQTSVMLNTELKPTLDELHEALVDYTKRTGRRFSFEFALMDGINTSVREIEALYQYGKDLLCHVNLIPLNEVEGSPFKPVTRKVLLLWQEALEMQGIACSIRNSRGSDIAGACGQLASKHFNS